LREAAMSYCRGVVTFQIYDRTAHAAPLSAASQAGHVGFFS
jgi:hypothetical protein